MSTLTLPRPRAPRAACGNMVLNEARLAWRQPAGMIAGAGIALLLLVIFGEIPVFRKSSASLGGYSPFDIYIPILMSFSIAMIASPIFQGRSFPTVSLASCVGCRRPRCPRTGCSPPRLSSRPASWWSRWH